MNNSEDYKKAMDQIHAPEELKQKTFEKITQKQKNNNIIPLRFLSAVAVFLLVFAIGFKQFNKQNIVYVDDKPQEQVIEPPIEKQEVEALPRFSNVQEIIDILKEQEKYQRNSISKSFEFGMMTDAMAVEESAKDETGAVGNHSTTNNQVDNVDEADIVKTDGKNIFYISNNVVNIINASDLELLSEIKCVRDDESGENFSPSQLFINGNKLVVIGEYSKRDTVIENDRNEEIEKETRYIDYAYINFIDMAKAMVYDITDGKNPKLIREVALDGYYKTARMIGDNVYLISNKGISYYNIKNTKEINILPTIEDSILDEKSMVIPCTNIAYFPGSDSYGYTLVGGFNINNEEPLNVETFFGAGETIYCSENNLYLTKTVYDEDYSSRNIEIYKFRISDSKIELAAKGNVEGYINNQFSLDEYDGNLRIATTLIKEPYKYDDETGEYTEEVTTNRVYVLDENLEELSRTEDLADGEKIYAVRFMGKIGYVVTFEQIDPLFVLDLSNPKNPEVKGKLKIPGYSSYLHPYDETHIIGIGYNTKSNGYGGVTNANMKMSMFDISDLSDPKEMFSINIGLEHAYSDIANNHKALFYKASDNLIGFGYNTYSDDYSKDFWSFDIFHIDLEKGFERFARFSQKIDYRTNIRRMIYIGNTLYGLALDKVTSYDLNTQEVLHELELTKSEEQEYFVRNSFMADDTLDVMVPEEW